MSAQIRHDRDDYYDMLEDAQKGTLDITESLEWFLECLDRAFDGVEQAQHKASINIRQGFAFLQTLVFLGGDGGIRTHDLLNAKDMFRVITGKEILGKPRNY